MANTALQKSTQYAHSYQPRALVKLFGNFYVPSSIEIQHNSHGATDTATVTLPIVGEDPVSKKTIPDFIGMSRSSTINAYPIAIYAGFPPSAALGSFSAQQLALRFDGMLDIINPVYGENYYEITCRSWAAILIETKTTASWQNFTTTQLVQALAAKHKLTANIQLRRVKMSDGSTAQQEPQLVSTVYGQTFTVGTRNFQEWDLLLACAQADDVDLWVDGQTLNYVAPELVTRPRLYFEYGKDIAKIQASHAASFSKFVSVEVRSYQPKITIGTVSRVSQSADGNVTTSTRQVQRSRASIFGTLTSVSSSVSIGDNGSVSTSHGVSTQSGGAASSGPTSSPGDTLKMKYVFHRPGLNRAACDKLALAIWRDISAHEIVATMERAVTHEILDNLNATTVFQLSGLPTASANGPYYVKRIDETFSVSQDPDSSESEGWNFEAILVNHALPTGGGL